MKDIILATIISGSLTIFPYAIMNPGDAPAMWAGLLFLISLPYLVDFYQSN
jgi:hypothetical protein